MPADWRRADAPPSSSDRSVISNLSQFRKMNKKSRGVNEEEVAYDALTKSAGGGNLDRKRVHTQFRPDSQLVQP